MTNGTGTGTQLIIDIPPAAQNKVVIPDSGIGLSASVKFTNSTSDVVRLWIPKGDLLFTAPPTGYQDYNDIKISAGQSLPPLTVKTGPAAPPRNVYPYHVYCKCIEGYAEGPNSPPQMSVP